MNFRAPRLACADGERKKEKKKENGKREERNISNSSHPIIYRRVRKDFDPLKKEKYGSREIRKKKEEEEKNDKRKYGSYNKFLLEAKKTPNEKTKFFPRPRGSEYKEASTVLNVSSPTTIAFPFSIRIFLHRNHFISTTRHINIYL